MNELRWKLGTRMYIQYMNYTFLTTITRICWMNFHSQYLIDLVEEDDGLKFIMFEKDIVDCEPVIICGVL
jgi:hypothetical protein